MMRICGISLVFWVSVLFAIAFASDNVSFSSPTCSACDSVDAISFIYKVKRGDTLWDISAAKLNDPFKWPLIWKNNPHIKNPHWIYPGQKIYIDNISTFDTTLSPDKVTASKRQTPLLTVKSTEPDAKVINSELTTPALSKQKFLLHAIVTDTAEYVGKVQGSILGKTASGTFDTVTVRLTVAPAVGDTFLVAEPFRPIKTAKPKETILGYALQIKGKLKITKILDSTVLALITESYKEIKEGDILLFDKEYAIPLLEGQVRASVDTNDASIIATASDKTAVACNEIVYINKGSLDNIKPGFVFTVSDKSQALLNKADLMILNVSKHMSSALIINCSRELQVGDKVAKNH